MGLKKVSGGKKYNGVYEYRKGKGIDSIVTGYYIQYKDESNTTRTRKVDAKDKDEALYMLQAVKADTREKRKQIESGEIEINRRKLDGTLTLDDFAKEFHPRRENRDAKAELAMYKNHIKPQLEKMRLRRLKEDDVIKFRKHLQSKTVETPVVINGKSKIEKRHLKARTVKKILDYLRVLLNEAKREGYIVDHPIDFTKHGKEAKKRIYGKNMETELDDTESGRVLTDDELETLWSLDELRLNDRLHLFLKACYYTGARPGGVIEIQVKHIDFENKTVSIRPMKGGKRYEARVSGELMDLFKAWIVKHDLKPDHYIFYPIQSYLRGDKTAKGKHAQYTGYRRLLQKIFDPVFNEGLDSYDKMNRVNVYSMRRTSATKVYKKHGIVHAKMFLNHSDIKTTMHYLNINDDMLEVDYGL